MPSLTAYAHPRRTCLRVLPKHLWITLILMFSTIMLGPLAWIITSRVSAAEKRGGQLNGGLWSAEKA